MIAPARFLSAMMSPLRSLRVIVRNRELRRLAMAAAVLCFLVLAGLAVALWKWAGPLFDLLWKKPEGGLLALWYVAEVVLAGVVFVIGAMALTALANSPFLDPLSAATERTLGIEQESGGLRRLVSESARSISKNFMRVGILLAGQVALLVLLPIPVVNKAYLPLSIIWSVLGLSFEYLDVPGNRHGHKFRDTLRFLKRDWAASLGLGLGLYIALWVPILNCFLVPAGVVAATTMYHRMKRLPQPQEPEKLHA